MHTPTEVVCLADLDATVRLITRFALDLTAEASFVPGMGGATAGGDEDTEAAGEE